MKLPENSDYVDQNVFNENFTKLDTYVTDLTQICTLSNADVMTITEPPQRINFESIIKNGGVFALSAGGAKVMESGFVIAHAHIAFEGLWDGDAVVTDVQLNGQNRWAATLVKASGWWETIDQTTPLIAVQKNDLISLSVYHGSEFQDPHIRRGTLKVPASFMNVYFYKNVN